MSPARAPRPPLSDEVFLKRQRDMTLATRGRRSGKSHRVTLWFVHEAGRLYLMAYARRHGRGTDWYQNLRRARRGVVEVGERRYEGEWETVQDPAAALAQITDLFSGKYGRQMVASYYLETKRFPVIVRLRPISS
ncbi:MAG: nitroreductase/quinone reductase family protein [bacterium]